jgi:hypothetical protein
MSTQNSTCLSIEAAQRILAPFNCKQPKSVNSEEEKALVRQALLLLTRMSDYQILGICADNLAQGLLALETYSQSLGYEATLDSPAIEGSVYIKFNPKTGLCYLDSYAGHHRGVLVSCQSAYDEGINEMYGHLPLDLFV